jgi:hypothetical protein
MTTTDHASIALLANRIALRRGWRIADPSPALLRRLAARVERYVRANPPVVSVLEARNALGITGGAFDCAVRLLLDERRLSGWCDRDREALRDEEHVDGLTILARGAA